VEHVNEEVSKCITPNCGKDARWKGLCQTCYGAAKRLIEEGKTTWPELQDLGLAIIPNELIRAEFFKRTQANDKQPKKGETDA